MAVMLAGTAAAQPSFGFGITFPSYITDYSFDYQIDDYMEMNTAYDYKTSGAVFFAYLDYHYIMVSLGLGFHNITPPYGGITNPPDSEKPKYQRQTLNTFEIEILGKYPINLPLEMTIFPMFGINLKMVFANDLTYDGKTTTYEEDIDYSDPDYYPISALNTLWVKFGVGMDIPLNSAYTIYIRPILLYGIGTNDMFQKDELEYRYSDGSRNVTSIVNHGLELKITIGFIF